MADAAHLKVALLARSGEAREQLRRAIIELGAELVVEADPNDLTPGVLGAAGVTAVLVSVEPAIEAALDRFDDELLAPGLTVLYDEAETTSKLSGWDQARWARHLAAKLLGGDALPSVSMSAAGGEGEGGCDVDEAALRADPELLKLAATLDAGAAFYAPPAASKHEFDFGSLDGLSLTPLHDAQASTSPVVAVPPPVLDLGPLSLIPLDDVDKPQAAPVGTILVLSGIGGPDALRQLVRALPAGFPLSVLLQQSLDGGRHDRFVEQLAKISRLPVALAESQETPPPGAVRVLPEGLSGAGSLIFPYEEGVAALIHAVRVRDGAVIVLSGADEAAIEPLKQALLAGFRVLVQDPDTCFDPQVAAALRAAGAPALPAGNLAARLDMYFPT